MRSSCVAHAASAFGQHATENHALLKPSLEKMIRGDDGHLQTDLEQVRSYNLSRSHATSCPVALLPQLLTQEQKVLTYNMCPRCTVTGLKRRPGLCPEELKGAASQQSMALATSRIGRLTGLGCDQSDGQCQALTKGSYRHAVPPLPSFLKHAEEKLKIEARNEHDNPSAKLMKPEEARNWCKFRPLVDWKLRRPAAQKPVCLLQLLQEVGVGYVIQAPSASVTKRAAGSPKEAFGGLETQVAGASYLMQAPCASASSKGKSVESPKEAFGGLETQVAGASYLMQAPCASASSKGKSVESPKEAFGGLETQVAGTSYLIQAPCASTSSKGKSVESPKEACGGLETQVAEESPESPKCSTSPQAKSLFRCPECNAFVSSMEEALKHCGTLGDGGQPTSPSCLPSGEAIAFDEQGRMLIVRVTQPTGERETVVRLPDGQQRTFDASSVKKMIESPEKEVSEFLENLSHTELRGLVHEVGQRLLEGSRLYHSRLAELDRYRKLAKKMHPDKNGGTDEAKQRFQAMKERYEALKKKLSEDNVDKESEGRKNEEPEEREPKEKNEKKDKKEDSNDDAKSIEYDPSNKESMVSTVVKMAGQLKNIDVQMDILLKELSRMSQHPEGT
ncbi:unnamed protein product [Cladocopium goreaui]|uniref:DnaJ-related protein SCJ1 n=1 Tax=Cladocopium goreaui TaxID=2562237 RepID=A0A9P1G3S3_9DINO|nr:unnamed protein product [Cladocopium goreaui]